MARKTDKKEKKQKDTEKKKYGKKAGKKTKKQAKSSGKRKKKSAPAKEEKKEAPKKKGKSAKKDDSKKKGGKKDSEKEAAEKEKSEKKSSDEEESPKKAERKRRPRGEGELTEWAPKTKLGRDVVSGKYKDMNEVLASGEILLEPEIVDYLVPNLEDEIIYVGGTPGKGGGIRRTPTRRTTRIHKSGRRFTLTAVVVVGNRDGIVGLGTAKSNDNRTAIEKAKEQAKLNVINVRRGCGSWECNCGGEHSVPFRTEGVSGSVLVKLLPTPKGVGIVSDSETKKVFGLAGIKDLWTKKFGRTRTRISLSFAAFNALKNLKNTKGDM